MLRRLLIAAVLVAGFAAVASPRVLAAGTPPPCPDPQPQSISSAHFTVTYQDDPTKSNAITQVDAQMLLGQAEHAYAVFGGLGFPTPATMPSGKTEIDVVDLSSVQLGTLYCGGSFDFDSATIGQPSGEYDLDLAIFGAIAIGQGVTDGWLTQGLGSWAAYKALGYPADSTLDLGPWETSLDCTSSVTTNGCAKSDSYANLGLSRWPFYEYLTERFTTSFVDELLADAAAAGGITGLENALKAHNTSLAAEYGAFTTKLLAGGWSVGGLNVQLPPVSATISTGAATGDTAAQTFSVGHLATRYVEIDRGDGSNSHKCYAATLTITVGMPAGVTSQPVFYWAAANNTPVPLTVSGSTATATVPWDTCTWSTHGYLSLPNATTDVEGASFQVSTHLAVTSTETTSAPPSTPANSYGNSTDAASAVGALAVSLRGPGTLKLSPTDTSLDLVVEANDQGKVSAKLGALSLGTRTVVPGMNAVHFSIPAGATGTLTVTPTSSDGTTVGRAVTMIVAKDAPSTLKRNLRLKRNARKHPKLEQTVRKKRAKK